MAKGGLKEWFKQNWVDIGPRKKMVLFPSVVDQNKRKMQKENILNVFR